MIRDQQVATILSEIGLSHLIDRFAQEDIDFSLLTKLHEDDLRELGLTLGQRRKLRDHLTQLSGQVTKHTAPAPEPELRRITVLFSDLVGFTELLSQIDPDEMRAILQRYYKAAQDAARQHGGCVAALQGDGVIILFGFPLTLSKTADRAIGAAMALRTALDSQPEQRIGDLQVRVEARFGIASGSVLVGYPDKDPNRDLQLIGSPVNRASRLQNFAHPGAILVDENTRALSAHGYAFQSLPPVSLKGFSGKTQIAEVTAEPQLHLNADSPETAPSAYRAQMERLLSLWEQAKHQQSVFALISGEAGIGKSTLVRDVVRRLRDESVRVIEIRCDPLAESVPLHPVMTWLDTLLGTAVDADPEHRLTSLRRLFGQVSSEHLEAVAAFLGLASTHSAQPPARLRARFLDAMADLLVNTSKGPCLIVMEDCHWSDPTTRELLDTCAQKAASAGVMMLCTSRNADDPICSAPPARAEIRLTGLTQEDASRLLEHHLGSLTLPDSVTRQMLSRSNGNPLMLEVLARSAPEWTKDPLVQTVQVPASIYESIANRLDMLKLGQRVAGALAVFNEPTRKSDLALVLDVPLDDLQDAVQELVSSGIAQTAGLRQDTRLSLAHSLYRDVCYERLVKSSREALHLAVFNVLNESDADVTGDQAAKLSWHAFQAGQHAKAAPLAYAAGAAALQRSAMIEATHFLERALVSLDRLNATPAFTRLRLKVLTAQSSVCRARIGIASDEVGTLSRQQLELARSIGDSESELAALNGLLAHALVRADYAVAQTWAARLMETAQATQDATFVMIGLRGAGSVALHTGAIAEGVEKLRAALAQYDEARHLHLTHVQGYDQAEICAVFLSFAEWLHGDPVAAEASSAFAVSHSRRIEHVHSLAQALLFRAMLMALAGNGPEAIACSSEALELGQMHDLAVMRGASGFMSEAAALICGQTPPEDAALKSLLSRHKELLKVNPYNYQPISGAILARALLLGDDRDAAKVALDHAEKMQDATGETMVRPELMRLRAQLRIAEGELAEGLAGLAAAHDTANDMGAHMLALRIACDMAELSPSEATRTLLQTTFQRMSSHDQGADVLRARALLG